MKHEMNPENNIGSWDFRKSRLQEKFPTLSDTDLMLDTSNRVKMFENLQMKLGKTSEEMHAIIIAL